VYDLFVLPQAQKDLDKLELLVLERIVKRLRLLSKDPRPHGSLKMTAEEGHRIRVGDHRVLYRIDDDSRRIYIYRVRHRKGVYR
jgi:mRNA interferase RelE/StbE